MPIGVASRAWQGLAAFSLMVACSASSGPSSGTTSSGGANSGTSGSATMVPSTAGTSATPGAAGTLMVDVGTAGGGAGGSGGVASCVTVPATADVTRQPVDIIVVIDNSGSMQEEIDAVEKNINV